MLPYTPRRAEHQHRPCPAPSPAYPPVAAGVGLRPSGVFFGLEGLDFGARAVGAVCTLKIPLCNPLPSPQLVVIQVGEQPGTTKAGRAGSQS